MSKEDFLIKPFLKKENCLLIAGSHSFLNSRFAFNVCADLIKEDSLFLDTYEISDINRPKNILIIKSDESRYEIEDKYSDQYRIHQTDENIRLFSHLFFVDRYDLQNKSFEEALDIIESKILTNKIGLVVLDQFKFFEDYLEDAVDEVCFGVNQIIKQFELPLIVVDYSRDKIDNYANGSNNFCKYADEIIYLNKYESEVKLSHVKTSDRQVNDIILKLDKKYFYRVYLNIKKTKEEILYEAMAENDFRYEMKADLVANIRHKLRAYDMKSSYSAAIGIIDPAIESGYLISRRGKSNNYIITLPDKNREV